jgi:hypothetical protein
MICTFTIHFCYSITFMVSRHPNTLCPTKTKWLQIVRKKVFQSDGVRLPQHYPALYHVNQERCCIKTWYKDSSTVLLHWVDSACISIIQHCFIKVLGVEYQIVSGFLKMYQSGGLGHWISRTTLFDSIWCCADCRWVNFQDYISLLNLLLNAECAEATLSIICDTGWIWCLVTIFLLLTDAEIFNAETFSVIRRCCHHAMSATNFLLMLKVSEGNTVEKCHSE